MEGLNKENKEKILSKCKKFLNDYTNCQVNSMSDEEILEQVRNEISIANDITDSHGYLADLIE